MLHYAVFQLLYLTWLHCQYFRVCCMMFLFLMISTKMLIGDSLSWSHHFSTLISYQWLRDRREYHMSISADQCMKSILQYQQKELLHGFVYAFIIDK